ncbi:MAG TPA: TIGR03790 family protein [Tepidisphaeraceae bacterium]
MKLIKLLLFAAAAVGAVAFAPAKSWAILTPDQIALVTNKAVPESLELAKFYTRARGIPDDRIIQLDLPTTDEMPFDRYERDVTPPIRQFLRSHGLEQKVRCIVTFYGVPLRISDRVNSVLDNNELNALKQTAQQISGKLNQQAVEVEKRAVELDGSFKPASAEQTPQALSTRIQRALITIEAARGKTADPAQREALAKSVAETLASLAQPGPPTKPSATTNPSTTMPTAAEAAEAAWRPFDPSARQLIREHTRRTANIFAYLRLLNAQIEYLTTDATAAAVDNELALLWWPPMYVRSQWQPNLLNPQYAAAAHTEVPPLVMVMRLDGPSPEIVKDIITTSIAVERDGLKGQFVVDARGIAPQDSAGKPDALGTFDQRLRDLASFVQTRSAIPVKLDDKPDVIPPRSVGDVALYCGWYSVRNFVPGMNFNRGAVGYHVASFELISLRQLNEGGWCRGLLKSGVVATLGPVAEPYLHSFPNPEEFFPLLMTGKLTLAEVYWTTTPLTSWMQASIGDPLYNPYAAKPAVKVDDLPQMLRSAIQAPHPVGR